MSRPEPALPLNNPNRHPLAVRHVARPLVSPDNSGHHRTAGRRWNPSLHTTPWSIR
jgi:hypothetical protein